MTTNKENLFSSRTITYNEHIFTAKLRVNPIIYVFFEQQEINYTCLYQCVFMDVSWLKMRHIFSESSPYLDSF